MRDSEDLNPPKAWANWIVDVVADVELRCEAIAPGHLRVDLAAPSSATPEH
jgi:hypothetical protein